MNIVRLRKLRSFLPVKLAGAFLISCIFIAASNQAQAQRNTYNITANDTTVKALIGSAVSVDFGKYTDIKSAITRFKNQKFDEARIYLGKARSKYPQLPPTETMMAKLFFIVKDTSRGMLSLEKAIGEAPNDPEAYLNLAQLNLSERRFTTAKLLAEKGLELTSTLKGSAKRTQIFTNSALRYLASVAINHKQWVEAEKQLRAWLKNDPDVALVAHQNLGIVLYHQKKSKEAYAEFQAAYKEDKKKASAPEVALARLYEKDDKRSIAEQLMKKAVQKYPKDFNTRFAVAQWAMNTKQLAIATTSAEAAIKADSSSLNAKLLRGFIARLDGDIPTATKYFEAAHLQSPSNFDASNHLALILIESKDEKQRQRGLEFARLNYDRYPINGRANHRFESASTMGWISYKLKNYSQALQLFNAVSNAGQLSADAAFYVATFLHDQRRNNEAVKVLESRMNTDRPFMNRKAAESLLKQLNPSK